MAQTASEAESLFNSRQYLKAKVVYETLLKKKPSDALYNYRMARCCYELKDYESAIQHFELSGSRYPMKDLYLSELYFFTYRFDMSVTAYQSYIATLPPNDSKIEELNGKIKKSELGSKLMNRVQDIAIIDSTIVNKSDFLKYYKLNSELGTVTQQRIKLSKTGIQDKISYTTQRRDRLCYSDSTHGNMDVFSSFKLLNDWTVATSISKKINTKANENYPFLMLDGVTLYFASDGENSLGGYDLFITKYNPDTKDYLIPENIGLPFNSPANDYMLAIDEQQREGWFATDRNQPNSKVMIYRFVNNESKKIFRSTNSDSLRWVAQLKLYRRAEKKNQNIQTELIQQEPNQQISDFRVIINDSTVYTKPEQFKSQTAMSNIIEWRRLSTETDKIKHTLNDLRLLYENELNLTKKSEIGNQIIQSEQKLITTRKRVNEILIEAVNMEINYIKNLKR